MRGGNSHRGQEKKLRGLLLIVLVLIVGFLLLHRWEAANSQTGASGQEEDYLRVRYNDRWYRENPDLETFLLMGLDDFSDGGKGVQQADFLLLLVVDREKNICTPLHLNRDTMTQMSVLNVFGEGYDTKIQQLALSHSYGSGREDSCRNTVRTVSDLLYGIHIDHYISVTMEAVGVLNDLLGGVSVHVTDDFSRVDPAIRQGEDVTLHGEQALHFVRARSEMDEPTNLARMERQRVYVRALQEKLMERLETDENFGLKVMMKLSEYMVSDCTVEKMAQMLEDYTVYRIADIQTTKGEALEGAEFMEFYLDEAALQQQAIKLFFVEDSRQ